MQRVAEAIGAENVAVYLLEPEQGDYVLAAATTVPQDQVATIRISQDEGLIGLIGRREEPIHLEDATQHPSYADNPLLPNPGLHAFLGVPMIQHRQLYGVLVAERKELRYFDDAEEAFLVTLAAQLGNIIAHAPRESLPSMVFNGLGCVPGVGIGSAVVVYPQADLEAVPLCIIEDIEQEIALFQKALQATQESIRRLGRQMTAHVSEKELALFDVYLHLLDNESLGIEVTTLIRSERLSAEAALAKVIKTHVLQFDDFNDAYLRERVSDFREIGRRVLAQLQSSSQETVIYPRRAILIGEEITAAALAEVPAGQLVGIVSAKGSNTSHVAILARAMNVPTVMGVRGLTLENLARRAVIVDGYNGHAFVSPSRAVFAEYKQWLQDEDELNHRLESLRDKPAKTTDDHRVSLQVNTGLALDAGLSMSVGAEGVGLYRSEITFMSRDRFPTEDEQTIIYRQILKAFAPRPVTMRTLDIGGDKMLMYFPMNKEDNPYLGWRGIRVTLDHPDMFLIQVRAMMRANEGLNNLRIMLPMVTTLSEVDEALYLIDKAYHELQEEGLHMNKPELGVMIEVPAAAYLSRELGARVNFLSVGSNDLAQYLLAVDRNNARVAQLYNTMHPAMLRMLLKIVEGGHAAGVDVSICGEMANDPLSVILLVAMGFDMLSLHPTSLLRVKWVIRHFSIASARKLLSDVLLMEHASQIRTHLQQVFEQEGLGALIRTRKLC